MNKKLPTAEETLNEFYPTEYINPSLKAVLVDAIESHTAAHTAALRERVKELESENKDYYLKVKELEFVAQVDNDCIESQSNEIDQLKAWKQSAMAEAEKLNIQSIGLEIGCRLGSSIPEQVLPWIREQKAKIASYESAIDGLKKVVDSLYNLKS